MDEPSIDQTFDRLLNWERAEKALDGPRMGYPSKTNFAIVKSDGIESFDVDDFEKVDKVIADWRYKFDHTTPQSEYKSRKNGRGTIMFLCMRAMLRYDSPAQEKAQKCGVNERLFNQLSREAVAITHWRLHPHLSPVIS